MFLALYAFRYKLFSCFPYLYAGARNHLTRRKSNILSLTEETPSPFSISQSLLRKRCIEQAQNSRIQNFFKANYHPRHPSYLDSLDAIALISRQNRDDPYFPYHKVRDSCFLNRRRYRVVSLLEVRDRHLP